MIIDLNDTVLRDEEGRPLKVYNAGFYPDKMDFLPLSHFGCSKEMALVRMKSRYLPYLRDCSLIERQKIDYELKRKDILDIDFRRILKRDIPKINLQEVYLCFKKPLILSDFQNHNDFDEWREKLKGKIYYGSEKNVYNDDYFDFIFQNPYSLSEDRILKELNMETLYSGNRLEKIYEKMKESKSLNNTHNTFDTYHDFLIAYLVRQRMIRALEKNGYDGIRYKNKVECPGQEAYIILRPETVFEVGNKNNFSHDVNRPNEENEKKLNNIELSYIYKIKLNEYFNLKGR